MGSLCTLEETYSDHVRVPIVLVLRASLKYFCDPHIAKLFDGLEVGSHNEEMEAEIEKARLVFDPGSWVWMYSYKKRCLRQKRSMFLFEGYGTDLRTNLFEERENDAIMGSLSMWKEAYKDTLKNACKDVLFKAKLSDV